jgi:hypothetical protein
MKLLCFLLVAACVFGQAQTSSTNPGYCGGSNAAWAEMREDLQDDIQDTQKLIGGMGARVTMLRYDAGNIQAFNGRDALQIDADLWQSLIDHMNAQPEAPGANRTMRCPRENCRCRRDQTKVRSAQAIAQLRLAAYCGPCSFT